MAHFAFRIRTRVGVLVGSYHHHAGRTENFCRLGLLTPLLWLRSMCWNSRKILLHLHAPIHFYHANTAGMFSIPFHLFSCECHARGTRPTFGPPGGYHSTRNVSKRKFRRLPRLARLRVRTPSAMVLSPPAEQVFSTAFMFSCSAASSAYCRPWGWLWQGGELLENLPDCGRKKICCFNWEQHGQQARGSTKNCKERILLPGLVWSAAIPKRAQQQLLLSQSIPSDQK